MRKFPARLWSSPLSLSRYLHSRGRKATSSIVQSSRTPDLYSSRFVDTRFYLALHKKLDRSIHPRIERDFVSFIFVVTNDEGFAKQIGEQVAGLKAGLKISSRGQRFG